MRSLPSWCSLFPLKCASAAPYRLKTVLLSLITTSKPGYGFVSGSWLLVIWGWFCFYPMPELAQKEHTEFPLFPPCWDGQEKEQQLLHRHTDIQTHRHATTPDSKTPQWRGTQGSAVPEMSQCWIPLGKGELRNRGEMAGDLQLLKLLPCSALSL